MAESDEERLAQELARGREEAFATLYDRYAQRLFRAACALLDSSHDAEDAVQAVFLGLVRSRATLVHVKNWAGYLLTSLRHEAAPLAVHRKRRMVQSIDEVDAVATPVELREASEVDQLQTALLELPAEQRQVVRLKTEAGLTFAEIADLLQISPNTVASRYRYAIDKLRENLRRADGSS